MARIKTAEQKKMASCEKMHVILHTSSLSHASKLASVVGIYMA